MKALEESLLQKHDASQAAKMLKPFRALADEREFWNNTLDGLAVFGSGPTGTVSLRHAASKRNDRTNMLYENPDQY